MSNIVHPPLPGRKADPDVREAFEALEQAGRELELVGRRKSGRAALRDHPACQRLNELLRLIREYPELTYEARVVYYGRLDATREAIRLAVNDARRTARAEAKATGREKKAILMAGRYAATTARSAAERHAVEQALAMARAVTKGEAT
ncbi:MAG: hypothetical protein LAN64_14285 [Acidobacteriia bacterium]|nr:hypothetical protein [Terriglobia bacterium]